MNFKAKIAIILLLTIWWSNSANARIVINPAASVYNNSGTLDVKGSWKNNGAFYPGLGKITFSSATNDTMFNTGTLNKLSIKKTSGQLFINSNLMINDSLIFLNGKMQTGAYTVTLGTSADVNNETATSYLEGFLKTIKPSTTVANSMGNIGFSLGAGNDLGNVTILRKTGTVGINSINGDSSIARAWEFSSQNTITGTRSITAKWLLPEDNYNTLSALKVWQSLSTKEGLAEKKMSQFVSEKSDFAEKFSDDKGWTNIPGTFNTTARTATFSITKNALYTFGDATAMALPFAEDFEGAFPPTGWTNVGWDTLTVGPTPRSKVAKAAYIPAGIKILTMPSLDIPANYRLRFSWRNNDSKKSLTPEKESSKITSENSNEKVALHDSTFCEISSDGTNWTVLKILSPTATQTTFNEVTINLSAGAGQVIRWRYKTDGTLSAWGSLLDNVYIEGVPNFTVTPSPKDFGNLQLADLPLEQEFTVSNTGIGSLVINSTSIAGSNAADFELTDVNAYPVTLGNSQNMTVKVKFDPLSVGFKRAALNFNSQDKAIIHPDSLFGSCYDSTVTVFPYVQDFEAENFPPSGWDNSQPTGWARFQISTVSHCARAFYNNGYNIPALRILTTAPIVLPANYRLRYYWRNNDSKSGSKDPKIILHDSTFCEISTDNTNWTVLKVLSASSQQTVYTEEAEDLSGYAGERIKIRWRYKTDGTNSAYSCLLDNINIETALGITENLLPKETKLYTNYPNPFNNNTLIRFDLNETRSVSLAIYNYKGEKIKQLINANLPAGTHETSFNATALSSGMYFCIFKAGSYEKNVKMMLVK